jgi:hypothetical protein
MGWLTQLAHAPSAAAKVRRIASGGGPRRVRVLGVGQPTGLIVPSSRLKLEVVSRSGAKTRWEPEIPVPFPYAWAYRLSRWLGVPVVSSHDPENLSFSVPLPRAGNRRGG